MENITEGQRDKFAIDFADWLDKLSPSQMVSVWSKNGEWKGLFTMDNEQLLENYKSALAKKNVTSQEHLATPAVVCCTSCKYGDDSPCKNCIDFDQHDTW